MSQAHDPEELSDCVGQVIDSQMLRGVRYRLESVVGEGTMSVAFFAQRMGAEGNAPVVLKITKPSFLGKVGDAAKMMILKEAVALGRLNESVPPSPYVVRLMDSGSVEVSSQHKRIDSPWNAVEYVHGGAEGTTLYDRIETSIHLTEYAFGPERAAHAIGSIAAGLDAIHGMDIIHRDISPGNVLCCGSGDTEMFKIADFGIARPIGLGQTFGEVAIGTPGYAAPEQLFPSQEARVQPQSDVFSFASVIYFLLTGEDLFEADTPVAAIVEAKAPERRSIAEAERLCPELREAPDAIAAIDQALARASHVEPSERPASAGELAKLLLPVFEPWNEPMSVRVESRRLKELEDLGRQVPAPPEFEWMVRQRPVDGFVARSVAWDSDGSCLALATHGLWYWTGTEWRPAPPFSLHVESLRFITRQSVGRWLLGGEGGQLVSYTPQGVATLRQSGSATVFERAAGDPVDIGVLVGSRDQEAPRLYGVISGRWLKPAALPRAAVIADVARMADERWLVVGRTNEGPGFVATYDPLMWASGRLDTPDVRAFVGCAGHPVLGIGVAVGAEGCVVTVRGDESSVSQVSPDANLSVAAVDSLGGCWTGAAGQLWYRGHTPNATWSLVWSDEQLRSPFVGLLAQEGRVVALTVDGAVVEGRRRR